MLAEVIFKRDPRSVSQVSPSQIIGDYVLLSVVLVRTTRATVNFAVSVGLSGDIVTANNILNVGPRMRFVVFDDHVELQYKDSSNVWQIEVSYTES